MLVVDDLVGWLIGRLAEAGYQKLTTLVRGSPEERAWKRAVKSAVQATAEEISPVGKEQAGRLAELISGAFGKPLPATLLPRKLTRLEGLYAGVAQQLSTLDDGRQPPAGQLGLPISVVAAQLTDHLVDEITNRGARGGPLTSLADQLNHDLTHLQMEEVKGMLAHLLGEVRGALSAPGGTAGSVGWPLAEVADPLALEVHHPVEPDVPQPGLPVLPTYVSRGHDAALAEVVAAAAAGASGIAVLVGGSSTGKTRACWQALELLRGLEPGWLLWHPIDPQAALAGLAGIEPRTVVWLNEGQRCLGPTDGSGEQVAARLRELLRDRTRGPVLVLATLWPEFWDDLTARPPGGADPHAQARELLTGGDIPVPSAFTTEQLRALEWAEDPRLTQAAAASRDGQVIQYLAGTPELLARYHNAPPAARALIHAAMDANRLGMRPALPRAFLEAAAPGYLTDTDWDLLPGDWLERALGYAAKPSKGVRGPLTPIRRRPGVPAGTGDEPAWQLADYLDQRGRRARSELIPPTFFWNAAASYAHPADLDGLGRAAASRGLLRDAASLYKRASGHGYALAGVNLVGLLSGVHHGDQRPAGWAAANASLDDPGAVTMLLYALQRAGAARQVTTLVDRDPAAHASLNNPEAVCFLLEALRSAGATGQVATLASRIAAHFSLDDTFGVGLLLDALREAGATSQAATLASRVAAHVSLDNPGAVVSLLYALGEAGATGQVATLLDRDPAAHARLDDTYHVARLLDALREAGATSQVATLASRAAAHARLGNPSAVAGLLGELRAAEAADQVTTLLARDPAAHGCLDNPESVAILLNALGDAGAADQVTTLLARDPAVHSCLDNPAAVASLLGTLRAAGATSQVATLASRVVAGFSLDNPYGLAWLINALREAGAAGQAATLASRAAHVSLANPSIVASLLGELRTAGATSQVATLLDRDPAAHAHLDDMSALVLLLDALREAGATGQVATLASRVAAHASLDNPGAIVSLLYELGEAGATGQAAALASSAAASASLDDPGAVAGLLGELRAAGATSQVATLLDRDPAAHASLKDPYGVAHLLHMLRETGAQAQTAALLERLPAAGLFHLFCEQGREEPFRFGREADGRPAMRWAWTDLN